ncbi:MAG: hypothetical protein RIF44_19495 [Nitratireductor sp.]|jgi:hypothetical protein
MMFSDRFLSALGGWQRGWGEEKARRMTLAEELRSAVQAENLPIQFRSVDSVCYRKRYLVPNNPQNGGDMGPLFINGFIEEGLASWTTDRKFAQNFKDPLRDGTFSAIFAHVPKSSEVLVNIPALWAESSFEASVKRFNDRSGVNADALLHFKFRQGEIIMDANLNFDDLVGVCGKSSPFEVLCEIEGLGADEERDALWEQLVEANKFPEEPTWLSPEATQNALNRAKDKFLAKHRATIESVVQNRTSK